MKNLNLVVGLSLGLLLAGCAGDDGSDDGPANDTGMTTPGTSTNTTPGGTTTDEPPDDTTTDDPPGDSTTGEPPDDTTTDEPPGDTSTGEDPTTGGPALSFETDVWPIIEGSCLGLPGSCHDPGSGGLVMIDTATAYGNLVDTPSTQVGALDRVEPGDPDQSYMWAKVTGNHLAVGGSGGQMPLGAGPLPQGDLDTIEQWILGGAQP